MNRHSPLVGRTARGSLLTLLASATVHVVVPVHATSQTPLVLAHGYSNTPGIWNPIVSDLGSAFNLFPVVAPQLGSANHIAAQASELLQTVANAGVGSGTAVTIGYSNGGLVSRQAAVSLPMRGIVTFGTPHTGLPLIDMIDQARQYATGAAQAGFGVYYAAADLAPVCPIQEDVCFMGIWSAAAAVDVIVVPAMINELLDEMMPPPALLEDDRPGSPFLTGLNSSSNLAAEAVNVPSRAGLAVTTSGYWFGGPYRLAASSLSDAQNMSALTYYIGSLAWLWADRLIAVSDSMFNAWIYYYEPIDWDKYYKMRSLASALYDVAAYLLTYEQAWCAFVNGGGTCGPSDAFIPVGAQQYPGSPVPFPVAAQEAHTALWMDAEVIFRVNQRVAAVLQGP